MYAWTATLSNPPPHIESAWIARVFNNYQLWVRLKKGAPKPAMRRYRTYSGAKSQFCKLHVDLKKHPRPVWVIEYKEIRVSV